MKKVQAKKLILLTVLSSSLFIVLLFVLLKPHFLNFRGPSGVYSTSDKSLILDFENDTGELKKNDGEKIEVVIKTASHYQIISLYDKQNEYDTKGFLGAYNVKMVKNDLILTSTGEHRGRFCVLKKLH